MFDLWLDIIVLVWEIDALGKSSGAQGAIEENDT